LLVTDALEGVTQADREVVDILRKRRKTVERQPRQYYWL
jgi:predicted GTPase